MFIVVVFHAQLCHNKAKKSQDSISKSMSFKTLFSLYFFSNHFISIIFSFILLFIG